MEFREFPKIARLFRPCIITEKIDGTNASVAIVDPRVDALPLGADDTAVAKRVEADTVLYMFAGSRTRWVTPNDDNYGWASWVKQHADELWQLGLGVHYGEWWGQKIQRNYGLKEKRFSLFNVSRWADDRVRPACCGVVPILYTGTFSTEAVNMQIEFLRANGSVAAPGWTKPEGVVVFHVASNHLYKITCEKDADPKGRA